MKNQNRILVIGLDGAEPKLVESWTNKSYLKNLCLFLRRGVYGRLRSALPPASPPAWASFATGKFPGKHGIYGFCKREYGKYDLRVVNSRSIRSKTLWEILSESNVKVGVINLFLTYPPPKVDGFIVSGPMTPSLDKEYTYPRSIKKEIDRVTNGYEIDIKKSHKPRVDKFLADLYRITKKRFEATKYLMDKYEWQFFFVRFSGTDGIQHWMWKYMDQNHPLHNRDKGRKYENAILAYWKKIDEIVGELVKKAGKDTTTIILSDHGHGPVYRQMVINRWLQQKGYLKIISHQSFMKRVLTATKLKDRLIYNDRLGVVDVALRILPKHLTRKINKTTTYRYEHVFKAGVDWRNTKAYCFEGATVGEIYLNMEGREPKGIVNKDDYEKVRSEIINQLGSLEDERTGERIKVKVYRREDLYSGPYVEEAPDILFTFEDWTYRTNPNLGHDYTFLDPTNARGMLENSWSGGHRSEGIFAAMGSCIREGWKLNCLNIVDVAPTTLHMLNVAVPNDMDGRVLKEIFKPESDVARREVKYQEPSDKEARRYEMSIEEEEGVKERLRALGYLD